LLPRYRPNNLNFRLMLIDEARLRRRGRASSDVGRTAEVVANATELLVVME